VAILIPLFNSFGLGIIGIALVLFYKAYRIQAESYKIQAESQNKILKAYQETAKETVNAITQRTNDIDNVFEYYKKAINESYKVKEQFSADRDRYIKAREEVILELKEIILHE